MTGNAQSGRPRSLNRDMAIICGETTYDGKPCRKCTQTKRYVHGGGCVNCGTLKRAEDRDALRAYKAQRTFGAQNFHIAQRMGMPLNRASEIMDKGATLTTYSAADLDELYKRCHEDPMCEFPRCKCKFYAHPESDALWSQKEPIDSSDGLVEEVDRNQYLAEIKTRRARDQKRQTEDPLGLDE